VSASLPGYLFTRAIRARREREPGASDKERRRRRRRRGQFNRSSLGN